MKALFILGSVECDTASLFERLADHPKIFPSSVNQLSHLSERGGIQSLPQLGISGHGTDGSSADGHRADGSSVESHRTGSYRSNGHRAKHVAGCFQTGFRMYQLMIDRVSFPHLAIDCSQMSQAIQQQAFDLGWTTKFIYIVRNPFELIESQFHYLHYLGQESIDADLCGEDYLGLCRYALHLQQYSEIFGNRSILVISLDELRQQPEKVLADCYRFLKVGPSWLHRFSTFPRPCNQMAAKNRRLIRNQRLIRNRKGVEPSTTVPINYPKAGHPKTGQLKTTSRRLTVDERLQIYEDLWTDMRVLELKYGVDVSNWGFDTWQVPTASAPSKKLAMIA